MHNKIDEGLREVDHRDGAARDQGTKKAGSGKLPAKKNTGGSELDVRLGLAESLHAVAGFPLATFFQNINALKALQNIAFDDETGGALEAFVLGHGG